MTAASSSPRITSVHPLWAVGGGLVVISGEGFPVDPPVQFRIGGELARATRVSGQAVTVTVPAGLEGGRTPVRVDGVPGETAYIEVATPLATGLHLVDSPVFDRDGNLYVTFSGSRGQQAPISIFVVRPDGTREPFAADVAQSDVDGLRSRRARSTSPRASTAASTGSRPTAPRRSTPPISASPAASPSVRTTRCMSGIGRARFCASRAGGPRWSRASRPASPHSISPSVRTAFLYVTAPTLAARDRGLPRFRWTARSRCSTTASAVRRGSPSTISGSLYVVDAIAGWQRRLPAVASIGPRSRRSRSSPAAT